jgi:hypothetical protein
MVFGGRKMIVKAIDYFQDGIARSVFDRKKNRLMNEAQGDSGVKNVRRGIAKGTSSPLTW